MSEPVSTPADLPALPRDLNEMLILASLRRAPLHGYQIALEIEQLSDGFFGFNHGTLYPILHRLAKEGLIDGTWEEGDGRRRKQYALTDAGRRHLQQRTGEWDRLRQHLADFLAVTRPVHPRASAG